MAYTTIKKPSDYFNTILYTGNGATSTAGTLARTITGVGFQPDFTWLKERTAVAGGYQTHGLHDAVRGATKWLGSNSTNAEDDVATGFSNGGLGSFTSDGFGIYSGTSGGTNNYNVNTGNYVSWNWLGANGTASNTDGSITSTVSANTTSGFSIVSYTGNGSDGATIGHGLGTTPSMVIVKRRDAAQNWTVAHSGINIASQSLALNLTTNATTFGDGWIDAWDSTTFTANQGTTSIVNVNANTGTYIAYCFAEKKGFSKFGSYTGNGSTDGTFVYTGFKPAFVIIKRTDTAENWTLFDNKRDVDNVAEHLIRPDTSAAEEIISSYRLDLLSNGFKLKTTDGKMNASGGSYIYMAFAEEPLVGDNPATAR